MLSLFKYGNYYYSISDRDSNHEYVIMKIDKIKIEGFTYNDIVDKRIVKSKNKRRIKNAIIDGKFDTFRKTK